MSAIPSDHVYDVLVLFEDVDLYRSTYSPFTWRVEVAYADPDNWVISDVELPSRTPGKWDVLPAYAPLRAVLVARSQCRDLADRIDAVILADMERHGRSDGDVNAEHRLGRAELGL